MALVAKGYRVVPQSLADNHGRGFRHVHLKEHRGVFKAAARSTAESKGGREVVFSKGQTLFVGNVDDQGVSWGDGMKANVCWCRMDTYAFETILHTIYL